MNFYILSNLLPFLGGCPIWDPNYVMVKEKCIYFENTELSYDDAIGNCKEIFGEAGRLFEPRNNDSYDQVLAAGKENFYWIGVNVRNVKKEFQYVSGDNVTFKKIVSGIDVFSGRARQLAKGHQSGCRSVF